MPMNLWSAMGTCLFGLVTIQNGVWPGKSLFGDLCRQQECSTFLADSLGHPQKRDELFFEAGTFAHIRDIGQKLAIHVDVNNDSSEGYEFTGMASFIVNVKNIPSKLSIIGFN